MKQHLAYFNLALQGARLRAQASPSDGLNVWLADDPAALAELARLLQAALNLRWYELGNADFSFNWPAPPGGNYIAEMTQRAETADGRAYWSLEARLERDGEESCAVSTRDVLDARDFAFERLEKHFRPELPAGLSAGIVAATRPPGGDPLFAPANLYYFPNDDALEERGALFVTTRLQRMIKRRLRIFLNRSRAANPDRSGEQLKQAILDNDLNGKPLLPQDWLEAVHKYTAASQARVSPGVNVVVRPDRWEISRFALEFRVGDRWYAWNKLPDDARQGIYIVSEILLQTGGLSFVLHPDAQISGQLLRKVMYFLKSASYEKQVFVLTTNPGLLNFLDVDHIASFQRLTPAADGFLELKPLSGPEQLAARYHVDSGGLLSDFYKQIAGKPKR